MNSNLDLYRLLQNLSTDPTLSIFGVTGIHENFVHGGAINFLPEEGDNKNHSQGGSVFATRIEIPGNLGKFSFSNSRE